MSQKGYFRNPPDFWTIPFDVFGFLGGYSRFYDMTNTVANVTFSDNMSVNKSMKNVRAE